MSWNYSFEERALKELKKLGREAQQRIIAYLDERVASDEDPRRFGKALRHEFAGLWRYRVGNYRLICSIEDNQLVVLVLRVAHRREVYD